MEEIENEDDPTAPPRSVRDTSFKLGKTVLIWDGRRVTDSTRASGAVTSEWRADSRRRGPMSARLVLRPQWTKAMVGSLRIEGGDDFADAIKTSPVRFVGARDSRGRRGADVRAMSLDASCGAPDVRP